MVQRGGCGQPGVEPIGVVRVDAIAAIGHSQLQRLHAGQVHVDQFGRLTSLHDPASPEHLAVASDHELDAAGMRLGSIVHAGKSLKAGGLALDVERQPTVGMATNSPCERLAPNREHLALDRLPDVRPVEILVHSAQIEVVQPEDGIRPSRTGDENEQEEKP